MNCIIYSFLSLSCFWKSILFIHRILHLVSNKICLIYQEINGCLYFVYLQRASTKCPAMTPTFTVLLPRRRTDWWVRRFARFISTRFKRHSVENSKNRRRAAVLGFRCFPTKFLNRDPVNVWMTLNRSRTRCWTSFDLIPWWTRPYRTRTKNLSFINAMWCSHGWSWINYESISLDSIWIIRSTMQDPVSINFIR